MDEVVVGDGVGARTVKVVLGQTQLRAPPLFLHPRGEPLLTLIDLVFIESQHNAAVVLRPRVAETDTMTRHI